MNLKHCFYLLLIFVVSLQSMDKPDQVVAKLAQIKSIKFSKPPLEQKVAGAQPSFAARYNSNGSKLITSVSFKCTVYDTSNYEPVFEIPLTDDPVSLCLDTHPTNPNIAALGHMAHPVSITNILNGTQLELLPTVTAGPWTVEFNNDGTQVVVATANGCSVVDLAANTATTLNSKSMMAARYNPVDNNIIAFSTTPGDDSAPNSIISLWDVRANRETLAMDPKLPVYGLAYNTDGLRLVNASAFNIEVWDTTTGKIFKYLNNAGKELKEPNPNYKNKATLYADCIRFLWDKRLGKRIFIAGTDSGNATICDIENPERSLQYSLYEGQIADSYALDITPDSNTLVTGSYEFGEVCVWDISKVKAALREKYLKSQEEKPLYNIEGDEIAQQAALEQALGITASYSEKPPQSGGCALL